VRAETQLSRKQTRKSSKLEAKVIKAAHARDSLGALSKLAKRVDGTYRFISDPPFIVPLAELTRDYHPDQLRELLATTFDGYRASLPDARRFLADRYLLIDIALKVVGVGSIGTRCFIILVEGKDAHDPLIMQAKEATASVLERCLEPSPYRNNGQRVVEGRRLMQSVSDVLLGWTRDPTGRDYYFRQLRDMKLSVLIEQLDVRNMDLYAQLCGSVLAKAHARTGDAAAISGYIGSSDACAEAFVEFAERYADQTERDYATYRAAITTGRVQTA
jgi:uncharacterized protein (DUF2252 family)